MSTFSICKPHWIRSMNEPQVVFWFLDFDMNLAPQDFLLEPSVPVHLHIHITPHVFLL